MRRGTNRSKAAPLGDGPRGVGRNRPKAYGWHLVSAEPAEIVHIDRRFNIAESTFAGNSVNEPLWLTCIAVLSLPDVDACLLQFSRLGPARGRARRKTTGCAGKACRAAVA